MSAFALTSRPASLVRPRSVSTSGSIPTSAFNGSSSSSSARSMLHTPGTCVGILYVNTRCGTGARVAALPVDDHRVGGENVSENVPARVSGKHHEMFLDHPRVESVRGAPNRAVVSVCKNKHCCRRGANELYMRLKDEAMVRRDIDIDVRTSGCLKHCKRGPAAHVSVFLEGEEAAREVICVNVGDRHDVGDLTVAYTMIE